MKSIEAARYSRYRIQLESHGTPRTANHRSEYAGLNHWYHIVACWVSYRYDYTPCVRCIQYSIKFDKSWPSPWPEIRIRLKGNGYMIELMDTGARSILAELRRRKAVFDTGYVIRLGCQPDFTSYCWWYPAYHSLIYLSQNTQNYK